MSAECCDMFPRCKIFIPLVHTGTNTIISATKASLDLCHSMPRGVPHPIRFTSVRRPLLHLFLVDFPGNSVHLRSFVSEFVFEPIGVRCFGWVISHRYFAFCNKTAISDSVSQSIILWFQGASQPKISGADHQNYLNTHLFSDILLPLRPATCAVTFYAVTFCNSAINVKYLWCQFFKNIWYYHKLQNFFC